MADGGSGRRRAGCRRYRSRCGADSSGRKAVLPRLRSAAHQRSRLDRPNCAQLSRARFVRREPPDRGHHCEDLRPAQKLGRFDPRSGIRRICGQKSMKAYLAILSSRFLALLQYRAAAIAGVGTQLFFGLVRVMIFDGFYRSSSSPQPMTVDQVVTYIWLGQAMLLLAMFDVDKDVAAMIRTGNVAYEMTRPLDLYTVWFTRALSGRAAPLLMRSIPIFIVSGLFLGLKAPASLSAGFLFVLSTCAGLVLAASLVALLTAGLFWTISGEGLNRLAVPAIFFLSGIVIPLPLFPSW